MDSLNNRIAMFSIHSDPLAGLGSQESGGQNIYVRYLCEELDKLGWQVDVFTRWDDANKKEIANIAKCSRLIRLKGGKIGHIPKTELFPILPEIYDNFLNFIGHKNPYSLFHGHYWDGGWLARKASSQFSKSLVENFHSVGIIRMETRKKYSKDGEEQDYFAKRLNTENEVIRDSSLIICLSQPEKSSLVRFYGCPAEKVVVIPGGVNIKQWKPIKKEKAREVLNLKKDDFIILYVGRLEWRKGIGTLISGAGLLKDEVPNLKVIIVGGQIFGRRKNKVDFKEYQRLLELAKKQNVEEIVTFVGRVPNGRLPFFYSAADALAVPSYYEPFGLVALEGMASKIPIVASRVGGLSIIIKDRENGLLFEPHNALDFKEKVLEIHHSGEFTKKLVDNAFQDIFQNYSWQLIAKQISDVYKSLIKENENSSNSSI